MSRQLSELRKMQRHQLNKVNKDELIESILSSGGEGDALDALHVKLNEVMSEMAEIKRMFTSPESVINKKFAELQSQVEKQAEIISKQQRFLEALDRKERESNIVILGVPDEHETLDGAVTDDEKLEKIWNQVGVMGVAGAHRRLGNNTTNEAAARRRRPILLSLTQKDLRNQILENAKRLKTSGDNYSKIFIKKDIHPSVRNEWRRLRNVEAPEKARPENAGCVIPLDTRQRKLYRDDIIIDTWNPQVF